MGIGDILFLVVSLVMAGMMYQFFKVIMAQRERIESLEANEKVQTEPAPAIDIERERDRLHQEGLRRQAEDGRPERNYSGELSTWAPEGMDRYAIMAHLANREWPEDTLLNLQTICTYPAGLMELIEDAIRYDEDDEDDERHFGPILCAMADMFSLPAPAIVRDELMGEDAKQLYEEMKELSEYGDVPLGLDTFDGWQGHLCDMARYPACIWLWRRRAQMSLEKLLDEGDESNGDFDDLWDGCMDARDTLQFLEALIPTDSRLFELEVHIEGMVEEWNLDQMLEEFWSGVLPIDSPIQSINSVPVPENTPEPLQDARTALTNVQQALEAGRRAAQAGATPEPQLVPNPYVHPDSLMARVQESMADSFTPSPAEMDDVPNHDDELPQQPSSSSSGSMDPYANCAPGDVEWMTATAPTGEYLIEEQLLQEYRDFVDLHMPRQSETTTGPDELNRETLCRALKWAHRVRQEPISKRATLVQNVRTAHSSGIQALVSDDWPTISPRGLVQAIMSYANFSRTNPDTQIRVRSGPLVERMSLFEWLQANPVFMPPPIRFRNHRSGFALSPADNASYSNAANGLPTHWGAPPIPLPPLVPPGPPATRPSVQRDQAAVDLENVNVAGPIRRPRRIRFRNNAEDEE